MAAAGINFTFLLYFFNFIFSTNSTRTASLIHFSFFIHFSYIFKEIKNDFCSCHFASASRLSPYGLHVCSELHQWKFFLTKLQFLLGFLGEAKAMSAWSPSLGFIEKLEQFLKMLELNIFNIWEIHTISSLNFYL